jgi:hypothetical protein
MQHTTWHTSSKQAEVLAEILSGRRNGTLKPRKCGRRPLPRGTGVYPPEHHVNEENIETKRFATRHMKQSHKLIRGGRARVVSASILILLSAFSALQVVLSGLANGAIYGLPSKLAEAIEMHRRVVLFSWSCLLLQGLIVAVLAPLFPLREARHSREANQYPRSGRA